MTDGRRKKIPGKPGNDGENKPGNEGDRFLRYARNDKGSTRNDGSGDVGETNLILLFILLRYLYFALFFLEEFLFLQ